jgi:hypothetical protein
MNSIESIIIVFSSILLIVMLGLFIKNFSNSSLREEIDILNLLNIYNAGLNTHALFNATYIPISKGFLNVSDDFIFLNNVSRINNGLKKIECNYSILIINNEGIICD